jgi:dTDP-glucose pyrophosphorylase
MVPEKDWKQTLVDPLATIESAIKVIDQGSLQICLVVDGDGRLLGTLTDGDVRRGILKSVPLHAPVTEVMTSNPTIGHPGESRKTLLEKLSQLDLRHVPIVDDAGKLVDLQLREDMINPPKQENWVALMAGGLGTRLRPMTEQMPKPLLPVGKKPLLETILETFIEHRFHQFYISVNYKAEMIKDHFRDGSDWGVEIRYLEEDKRLGTAGALSLIEDTHLAPLIVMNADLLTRVNFKNLLNFHEELGSQATMCVREYDFEVPFGVVNIEDHKIQSIVEKPVHSFLVNAGIYVINPDLLPALTYGKYMDMPGFFERILADGGNTAAFPIREYWIDIGRSDDLDQANWDIEKFMK